MSSSSNVTSSRRQPSSFLIGVGGPEFRVPPGVVARWLVRLLEKGLRDATRDQWNIPEQVREALRCLEQVAAAEPRSLPAGVPHGTSGSADSRSRHKIKYMTSSDVAERLGCSDRYVRHLASSGVLPCCRDGGAFKFDPADIEEFITDREEPA